MDIKELLDVLDLPVELAEKEIGEAKTVLHEHWVNRKVAHTDEDITKAVIGKRMNVIEQTIGKEYGLTADEMKDKKVEDLIGIGAKKFKTEIQTLKESASPDTKEWDKKLSTLQKEKDTLQQMLKDNEQIILQKDQEYTGIIKTITLNTKMEKLKSGIEFSETATELSKKGFDAVLNEKYKWDLDESGEIVATDLNGEKIPNEKKTAFLSPLEVLKLEALNNNILKMPGAPSGQTKTIPPAATLPANNGQAGRTLPKNVGKYN